MNLTDGTINIDTIRLTTILKDTFLYTATPTQCLQKLHG